MQVRVYVRNGRDEVLENGFFSGKPAGHNCVDKGLCDENLVEMWCEPDHDDAEVPFGSEWMERRCAAVKIVSGKCGQKLGH